MGQLFSIGQFSKLTGLTPRALRFYDASGILCPRVTNPDTGYRYYTRDQAFLAERIRLLRSIDMPLEDIDLFIREDGCCAQDLLLSHKRRIEERITCYQGALAVLEDLEQHDVNTYQVRFKDVSAQAVIYKRLKTSFGQIEKVRSRAFRDLYGFLEQHHVTPAGPGFSADVGVVRLQSFDTEIDLGAECVYLDVGVPVPEPVPNDLFDTCVWPASKVAFIHHTGPYEPLFLVYRTLAAHLAGQGLSQVMQTREVYHVGYAQTGDKNQLETEVQFFLPP